MPGDLFHLPCQWERHIKSSPDQHKITPVVTVFSLCIPIRCESLAGFNNVVECNVLGRISVVLPVPSMAYHYDALSAIRHVRDRRLIDRPDNSGAVCSDHHQVPSRYPSHG